MLYLSGHFCQTLSQEKCLLLVCKLQTSIFKYELYNGFIVYDFIPEYRECNEKSPRREEQASEWCVPLP